MRTEKIIVTAAMWTSGVLNRHGSDPLPTAPVVAAGLGSALAHTRFANGPIKKGDLINMKTGGVHKRYCAPICRIAMTGKHWDESSQIP